MVVKYAVGGAAWVCGMFSLLAAEQVWLDAGPDNVWSTTALNWDAGAGWVNGNTARFTGAGGTQAGETVDVSGALTVAGMAFETNGYVIADADADGTLALEGGGEIRVAHAADAAIVSEVVGGAGFTKTGPGRLQLSGANTFTGVVRVAEGTLRLSKWNPTVLGATGSGNGTVVESGATLDIYGAFTNNLNRAEDLALAGAGVDGLGALINTGTGCMNSGFSGTTTLLGDTTIGCTSRIDFRGNVAGGGHTLTKIGNSELAVGVQVNNCPIVINAGNYTYMNSLALGGADFDTTLNGGALRSYSSQTVTEHLICNGGAIVAAGGAANTFKLNGRMTLNGRTAVRGEQTYSTVELAGVLEGPGGLARDGIGTVVITGNANTYAGATVITAPLYLGRTNQAAGVFGAGPVTNTSTLYVDRSGSFVSSNGFFGSGSTIIRYGGEMVLSGSSSSCGVVRVASGGLALTNGAALKVYSRFYLSERTSSIGYPVDPTNVTAALKISDTALLDVYNIEAGNGSSVTGGGMTGIVEQAGGTVRTYGWSGDPGNFPGEYDGLRIAHWPQAYGVYNLRGGTVTVENGYRLAIATDGRGWMLQTGGELFASEVVVNARDGGGGYGRLTLEGGVMNVGSNGITAGAGAPYLIEFGGAGGVVRAATHFASALNATLVSNGTEAITFDTQAWGITLSGNLTGDGGLNKTGTGTLTLSGNNTYAGPTRVLEGRLVRGAYAALPDMGEVLFGVTPDDAGGRLHADVDLALEGLVVGVANPEALDKSKHYTIATWGGGLASGFSGSVLPAPWYVHADWANKRLELRANRGTVLWLR